MANQYGQYDVPGANQCMALNVGQPRTDLLPDDTLDEIFTRLKERNHRGLLQYGKIQGFDEFRENLAEWLNMGERVCNNNLIPIKNHRQIKSCELLATDGVTGALSLILSTFAKSGDTIFCEDPTYFIALNIFKEVGLIVKPIKINSNGLDLEEFDDAMQKENPERNVFLYTIPINQNPTGFTMPNSRRLALARIADKYPKLLVLADEVYHFLSLNIAHY